MKLIKTDLIYDLLEDATLTIEAREFFEHLLNNSDKIEQTNKRVEDHDLTSQVGKLLAIFMDKLGKEEGVVVLKSICKAQTENEFKEVLIEIQEKLELHSSKCKGEA